MSDPLARLRSTPRSALVDELIECACNWISEHEGVEASDVRSTVLAVLRETRADGFDPTYEGISGLVRALVYWDGSGGRTPTHVRGSIMRALDHLDPGIAAEVARDGAATVYSQRWGTR